MKKKILFVLSLLCLLTSCNSKKKEEDLSIYSSVDERINIHE